MKRSKGIFCALIIKVVICGKYINLNKITKFLTYLPEIYQTSYFLLFSTVYNAK